ncbi:MAG: hypothetical protein ACK46Q_02860 [Hyphomonas sp.]
MRRFVKLGTVLRPANADRLQKWLVIAMMANAGKPADPGFAAARKNAPAPDIAGESAISNILGRQERAFILPGLACVGRNEMPDVEWIGIAIIRPRRLPVRIQAA